MDLIAVRSSNEFVVNVRGSNEGVNSASPQSRILINKNRKAHVRIHAAKAEYRSKTKPIQCYTSVRFVTPAILKK